MIPKIDYHMHTSLCNHAEGQPADYVKQALSVGLQEIGFSDHAPLVSHRDPTVTMDFEDLPTYYSLMEEVRETFKNELTIKIGIEADFIPGFETKTKTILDDYPYDYVFGSIHYIKEWGFDNPIQRQKWESKDVDEVYQIYYNLLQQSAQSGLFDIMAHVDLVKKFGHRPTKDLSALIHETAEIFKECAVAIEVNTSGLRKTVREIYPSLHDLKIYREHQVPIIFGSDAHQPEQVGMNFKEGLELARAAGYTNYVSYRQRKIEQIYPIE